MPNSSYFHDKLSLVCKNRFNDRYEIKSKNPSCDRKKEF